MTKYAELLKLLTYGGQKSLFLFIFSCLVSLSASSKEVVPQFNFDIYTQENGLPNNLIQCIYQDSKGWMWIGTSQGLSRFDGYGFRNFLPEHGDSSTLRGTLVRVISEDKNGNLLVGTENGGLNIFDPKTEKFSHPVLPDQIESSTGISVNDIEEDRSGNIWLGTELHILVMNREGGVRQINPINKDTRFGTEGSFVRVIQFDKNGLLWIGTNTGVYIYNPEMNHIEPFELPFAPNGNREIWEIYADEEGMLWIGTYGSGLFVTDPVSRVTRKIRLDPEIDRTETVRSVSKGFFGEYWIGTRGGLYTYSKLKGVTGFYRHDDRNPRSLSNNSVLSVFHDARGETWIGTRSGLNLLAKSKQVFRSFGSMPNDNHYLNSSTVFAFWKNKDGKIWIGTEDGGINIYDPRNGTFEYMMADETIKNSISQNCIKAFLNDANGNLWVGTFLGGIDVIDMNTREITHFKPDPDKEGSLSDNRIWDICSDKNGNIWVATSSGIDRFLPETQKFRHYPQLNGSNMVSWIECDSHGNLWMGSPVEIIVFNPDENTIKRFDESARNMFEDSRNQIWITTTNRGIALYHSEDGPLKYYNESNGLTNNNTLCILEDQKRFLWISTTNGLSRFDPETGIFYNYSVHDGLINNQFCYGAALQTSDGEMMFGSLSGFNLFNPSSIIPDETNVPMVFTDLKIFNKPVSIENNRKSVLKASISETDRITLNYHQNVFTIEFAALSYVNSANTLYTYKLEGFNREWNEPSVIRSATYTNLNPGDYVLRVKRVVPGIDNDKNELQLKITILPPYWKTKWFLSIMVVIIILLIYLLVRFVLNREKIKHQLVLEKVNARKLHELDMLKLKFFTNISHEIRTPLTLILGPLDKLINSDLSKEEMKENLHLMQRNTRNLDKLISQLLDFRKMQTGNLKLNLTEADIVEVVSTIVHSFNDYAAEKGISLKFNTLKKSLNAVFDPDKIEKILNNLISNSFKFTEQGGTISVNLSLIFDADDNDFKDAEKEKQFIEITVKDTGKGIAAGNLNKIFHRFFQSDTENANAGFGIGLALVKELVDIHKGNIFVTSKPGKGTKFTIRFPYYSELHDKQIESDDYKEDSDLSFIEKIHESEIEMGENLNSKIMLIVEDNADVRKFIASHFNSTYKIAEARNGDEGWEIAVEIIPDIIISDILMPVSDGYDLCKRIKNDERTSHIPVILLTALHSREHEIKGLTTGADDFITKPFDLSVLQAKVENLLSIRESLRHKFSGTVILEPKNVVISSPDERFLQKAIEVIEDNISDSDLDIESFSTKVGVSRMQLYRKLHALTDMTVKEFIRHIRLKRAAQLLVQKKMNVSEVAYEVGFKDLSHFRKCFKREYGVSASEYVATSKNKE